MSNPPVNGHIPRQASPSSEAVSRVVPLLPNRRTAEPPAGAERKRPRLHVHSFRFAREDPFAGANLYACRCGVVRHGL